MPIKDPSKYPDDWKERRASVLKRAGDRCECQGECGSRHKGDRCNAKNGSRGYWIRETPFAGPPVYKWKVDGKSSRIVLTTAHLDHELENHELDNLKALCQRCHLTFDARARKAEEEKDQGDLLVQKRRFA
jgi:hypothetical protein